MLGFLSRAARALILGVYITIVSGALKWGASQLV